MIEQVVIYMIVLSAVGFLVRKVFFAPRNEVKKSAPCSNCTSCK